MVWLSSSLELRILVASAGQLSPSSFHPAAALWGTHPSACARLAPSRFHCPMAGPISGAAAACPCSVRHESVWNGKGGLAIENGPASDTKASQHTHTHTLGGWSYTVVRDDCVTISSAVVLDGNPMTNSVLVLAMPTSWTTHDYDIYIYIYTRMSNCVTKVWDRGVLYGFWFGVVNNMIHLTLVFNSYVHRFYSNWDSCLKMVIHLRKIMLSVQINKWESYWCYKRNAFSH